MASVAEAAFDAVFAAAGGILAALALYQLLLAVSAFFYGKRSDGKERSTPPNSRVVVLVPAHDEAMLIRRCVASLREQTYPRELYDVVVIADNCSDDTAAVAASAGARVLVRDEPDARGKGRALRWAIDQLMATEQAPDAVVVVDADSVAEPAFLARLAAPFEAGAEVVQGESLLAEDGSAQAAMRAAAFLLVNRVRPAGRAVLHLPCNLAGNGMLFSRQVLTTYPWDAFTSAEDVEYSTRLRVGGVRPAFAGGAILLSPAAPTAEAASQQQLRWEGGKFHVARAQIPRVVAEAVRQRQPMLLDAALELAVPPMGFLLAGALAGVVVGIPLVSADLLAPWTLAPWMLALVGVPAYVLVGLRAGRAPATAYRSLAQTPLLLWRKIRGVHHLVTFRSDSWVRTERASEPADGAAPGQEIERDGADRSHSPPVK